MFIIWRNESLLEILLPLPLQMEMFGLAMDMKNMSQQTTQTTTANPITMNNHI